jgi:carbonic anhydrase
VKHSVSLIESSLQIQNEEAHGLKVIGALYCLESGKVAFDIRIDHLDQVNKRITIA